MNVMKMKGLSLSGGKSDQPTIKKVTYSDASLHEVYALFLRVRKQLVAKGLGHFLLPKEKEDFVRSLTGNTSFILGAYMPTQDGGEELVGFCVVKTHKSLSDAHAAKSFTLPDRFGAVQSLCNGKGVAVIQSLCVDGELAGKKGIAQKLLYGVRKKTAAYRQLAQTGVANLCGIKCFSSVGYVGVAAGTEVSNQCPSPKLLMMRLTRGENQKLRKKIQTTLAPQDPAHLYGVQTALYRQITQEGSFVKLQFPARTQALNAGLVPRATLPELSCG